MATASISASDRAARNWHQCSNLTEASLSGVAGVWALSERSGSLGSLLIEGLGTLGSSFLDMPQLSGRARVRLLGVNARDGDLSKIVEVELDCAIPHQLTQPARATDRHWHLLE